jgi:ethanolamine permease
MGALTLYFIAILSLFRLRKNEPYLPRPFSVPGYPVTPILALIISGTSFVLIAYNNLNLFFIYAGIILICFLLFKLLMTKKPVL